MGLLLPEVELVNLGVSNNPDDLGVLGDLGDGGVDGLVAVSPLLDVLGEGLFLGLVPVLVEPPPELVAEVLSPDGAEGAEALGGLNVADNADGNHGGGLEDGNGLDDLVL